MISTASSTCSSSSSSDSGLYGITTYCCCYCFCYCYSYSYSYCCLHLRRIDDERRCQADNVSVPGGSHGNEIRGEIVGGIGSGISSEICGEIGFLGGQALARRRSLSSASRAARNLLSGPENAAPSKALGPPERWAVTWAAASEGLCCVWPCSPCVGLASKPACISAWHRSRASGPSAAGGRTTRALSSPRPRTATIASPRRASSSARSSSPAYV